jgi:hypothetical protein
MKCKKFKEKIVLYFYDELNEEEKTELKIHIEGCPGCAQEFAQTKKAIALLDETRQEDLPEANWEKSWQAIDSYTGQKPKARRSYRLLHRWAYAGAALVFIFVVGILIGRFWLPSSEKLPPQPALSQTYVDQTLKQYIEELKPVLVEYANYSASESGEQTIVMDKRVARSLLIQNLLLRSIVAKSDPSISQFLDDVDLVLKEIANLNREDKQTPSLIKDLIHDREILFRMEVLQTL